MSSGKWTADLMEARRSHAKAPRRPDQMRRGKLRNAKEMQKAEKPMQKAECRIMKSESSMKAEKRHRKTESARDGEDGGEEKNGGDAA
jgi:hypothetical protein